MSLPHPTHAQEAHVPVSDRVPVAQKLAYGTGQIAGSLSGEIGNQLIKPVFVLNPAIGVSPGVIGVCEAIYRM